jgi:hypothetical protein
MRTVTLDYLRISISDDPDHLIRDIIECAFSPPYINQIEEMFAPDGNGLTVPDIIYACRVLEVMELPEYMWENPPIDIFNNEIWVISRLCPEPGAKECLIEGEELRHLLKEAKLVRAARDAKLQTS